MNIIKKILSKIKKNKKINENKKNSKEKVIPIEIKEWWELTDLKNINTTIMTGNLYENTTNPVEYAIKRWGNKLPQKNIKILFMAPIEKLIWINKIENVEKITIVDSEKYKNIIEKNYEDKKITIHSVDWKNPTLPNEEYHIAITWNYLGQLVNMEKMVADIRKKICDGGIIIIREYVGPDRYQFSDKQLEIANALLKVLPENKKRDVSGKIVQIQKKPELAWILENYPEAAIRASDVKGIIKKNMQIYEEKNLGGTLIAPLLMGIMHCYLSENKKNKQILNMIWNIEKELIDNNMINSDNWFAIATKIPEIPEIYKKNQINDYSIDNIE